MPQTATTEHKPIYTGNPSNDYHRLLVTEKQLNFARAVARKLGTLLPSDAQRDRRALSAWISENQGGARGGRLSHYPSSKQVAFAERIARLKRRDVPEECFRDRGLMSKWIDRNR
ncbi:MAG: hypothetical protein QNJ09_00570 [Paracoccaceae bacterium]|nr:hypothetical protein [Paracoccaceae bacterium]